MNTEDLQSPALVEIDSPPPKKIQRMDSALDLGTYGSSSFVFVTDPYSDSDLQSVIDGPAITIDKCASTQTIPETGVSSKGTAVQFEKCVSGDPSSVADKLPEHESSHFDFCQSVSIRNTKDDGVSEPETCNDINLKRRNEAGNAGNNESPSSVINVCVLKEILDVLDKNQSKTSEMIVQEYVSCPKRCLKVKELLSHDIYEFLESSGENDINKVGSAYLKGKMEKAECSTIIKLLSDAFKRNETKLASVDDNRSENSCVANVSCGPPAQTPAASDNVQIPNNTDDIRMEDDLHADEIIDIPNEDAPCISQPNVINMGNASGWQEKITDMLFRTLYAESRLLRRTEQKIARMGKRLFTTLFSEEEILGGFARAKKDTPAYDETRIFEISQIINFFLKQTNGYSLENFRSSQHENEGLDGGNRETFWNSVIVKFASDERKRIKVGKS